MKKAVLLGAVAQFTNMGHNTEMKKLAILLIAILIIVGGVLGYAVYNAGALAQRFKPELEKLATASLGSPVTIASIDASVLPSTHLNIMGFKIGQGAESLTLDNLELQVRLAALLSGGLDIKKLTLNSPTVTLIKDANGVRIQGMPKKTSNTADLANKTSAAPQPAKSPGGLPAGLNFNLEQFAIENAKIVFQETVNGRDYTVAPLNVSAALAIQGSTAQLSDLSISGTALEKLPFELRGASAKIDLESGALELPALTAALAKQEILLGADSNFKNGKGNATVTGKAIDLVRFTGLMAEFAPATSKLDLQGSVGLDLKAQWNNPTNYESSGDITLAKIGLNAGPSRISDLQGTIKVGADTKTISMRSENISLALSGQPVSAQFAAQLVDKLAKVSNLDISAFDGVIKSSAQLDLRSQQFSSSGEITDMQLGKIAAVVQPQLGNVLAGTLSRVTYVAKGTLGPTLMQTMQSNIGFLLKDGALKGTNLAGSVLKAVKGLPFITDSLYTSAPQSVRAALDSPDTEIKSLSGDLVISGGAAQTNNLALVSSIFSLDGSGTVGLDGEINLKATITFTKDFSTSLATANREIAKILDVNGQLVIPLILQGKAPKIIVLPNIEKLVEIAGKRLLKDGASKLLDGVLSGKNKGGKGLGGLLGF